MSVAHVSATPTALAQVPSLGYRILGGTARLVLLLIVLVGIPSAALAYVGSFGIPLPVSIATVVGAGGVIAVLSTAKYIARPTRGYGPLSVATSLASLGYLVVLGLNATYRIGVPGHAASISVSYLWLVDLLLLVPAIGLIAGVVTTLEDARRPGERLAYDYPT